MAKIIPVRPAESRVRGHLLFAAVAFLLASCAPAEDPESTDPPPGPAGLSGRELTVYVIARGDSLALPGEWTPPPGDALEHSTAGFAKILCSAVFLTGLDPADAAENVGYFSSPYEDRVYVTDTVVDYAREEVRLTLPSGVVRAAKRYGSQGCVARPIGEDSVFFTPVVVEPNLPDAATTPWPMGDVISDEPWPAEVDSALFAQAMEEGFGPPEAMTLALLVTYKGRILGERYAEGIGIHTPLESWSMGKSLTGALLGSLVQQGAYELWQPSPSGRLPETRGRRSASETSCGCLRGSGSGLLRIPTTTRPWATRTTSSTTPGR